jgi:hypothetical protein
MTAEKDDEKSTGRDAYSDYRACFAGSFGREKLKDDKRLDSFLCAVDLARFEYHAALEYSALGFAVMAFAFVLLGILALVTAIRGNQAAVASQVTSDFTGSGSGPGFWVWIAAILIFGLIGRVTGATGAMKLFVGLLIVVYLVSKQGIFGQLSTAFTQTSAPAATQTVETGAAVNASSGASPAFAAPASNPVAGAAQAVTSGIVSSLTKALSIP